MIEKEGLYAMLMSYGMDGRYGKDSHVYDFQMFMRSRNGCMIAELDCVTSMIGFRASAYNFASCWIYSIGIFIKSQSFLVVNMTWLM